MQVPLQVRLPEEPADQASYAKAILNILEDFSEERTRQAEGHRAVLNILEDIGAEKVRIEATQDAVLNILDDFDVEKRRVEDANRRLEERTTELARSNAELEMFAYVASHDLQEPLRMITSYTQLLAKRYRGRLDSDADEFIDFVVDGATRMSALIKDVLNFSRVGSKDLELSSTNCEDVLAQALTNLRVVVGETGAVVTHDPLPVLVADTAQLVQLFQNLIDNGIKFCVEQPPRVHLQARPEGGGWRLSFRDNGVGVDRAHDERIFQAFQRLHSRAYPGTGIGLAICRKIVDRHGGRLWVESGADSGSTFHISLPGHCTDDR